MCVYMKNIIKYMFVFLLSVLAMMMKKMIIVTYVSTRLECIITGYSILPILLIKSNSQIVRFFTKCDSKLLSLSDDTVKESDNPLYER